jgi:hypothetical protein
MTLCEPNLTFPIFILPKPILSQPKPEPKSKPKPEPKSKPKPDQS